MKEPGPNSIQNWVWVLEWKVVELHVTLLFRSLLTLGYIPKRWKTAKKVMLAKPGKDYYTQPGSYRPISLLNVDFQLPRARQLSHAIQP